MGRRRVSKPVMPNFKTTNSSFKKKLMLKHRCECFGVTDIRKHKLRYKEALNVWMSPRDSSDLVNGAHRIRVYL